MVRLNAGGSATAALSPESSRGHGEDNGEHGRDARDVARRLRLLGAQAEARGEEGVNRGGGPSTDLAGNTRVGIGGGRDGGKRELCSPWRQRRRRRGHGEHDGDAIDVFFLNGRRRKLEGGVVLG